MSKSPELGPILAALSPEAAEPLPNEGDDVVEAYSFNTGDLAEVLAARHICIGFHWLAYPPKNVLSQSTSHIRSLYRSYGADDDLVCFAWAQDSSKVCTLSQRLFVACWCIADSVALSQDRLLSTTSAHTCITGTLVKFLA